MWCWGIRLKVYSTHSGRQAISDISTAKGQWNTGTSPVVTSVARYLEDPNLTPLLRELIEQSALPLPAVETDSAADSTAFATTTYHRWLNHKWHKEIKEAQWVNLHVMCGLNTNVITTFDATVSRTHDSQYWKPFVEATARNFTINEVSGDKVYVSPETGGPWKPLAGRPPSCSRRTPSPTTLDRVKNRDGEVYTGAPGHPKREVCSSVTPLTRVQLAK